MSAGSYDLSTTPRPRRRLDIVFDHPRLIRLRGQLDHDTALMLAGVLKPFTTRGGTVRVDVAGLEAVDAAGIEVLLDAGRSLGRRGRLVLRDPSPAIKQLIAERPCDSVDLIDSTHDEPVHGGVPTTEHDTGGAGSERARGSRTT